MTINCKAYHFSKALLEYHGHITNEKVSLKTFLGCKILVEALDF